MTPDRMRIWMKWHGGVNVDKMTIKEVRDTCDMLIEAGHGDQGFRYWNFEETPRGDVYGVTSVAIYQKDGKSYPVFHGDD